MIDADKLEYSYIDEGDGVGEYPVVEKDDIINAPTIEAIPVKWLEGMAKEHDGIFNPYWFVLKTWEQGQKEREQDDGKT